MKITAEFDSIMEVLEFADTFGSKKLGATKGEIGAKTISEDAELTKPVQLHSPEVTPASITPPVQQVPPVAPVQITPPIQPVAPQYTQPVQPQQTPPQAQQIPQQNAAPPVAPVQTTTQSYTMEQLAVAATQIVDAGHRNELVSLLASFGVQALTALPKEQYGAFATQLRSLGAKI
ncbi:hypothetical protein [Clostridium pasteurianum]|uniref:Uncharacterized protein n=1 Tax=Clostridium pasteurianum BC1 TaxID=86416 RepID=R4K1H2_CLOPA|nr:hypothetical protein [Clostridium pasteurianum]AGK95606.1 hypothetical protein Clopa_0558 [Clostridium pasteurianum BC1]